MLCAARSQAGESIAAPAESGVGYRFLAPLFDRVTTAEVGRRAGFSDASHFVKALRRRSGQTPLQMRRASYGTLIAPSATSAD
jgi:AraC-like DNA-binding protein